MSFNGSGVFSRLHSWISDAANGLKISSSRMDADTNDIATGLSNCICKDGQTTITQDIPFSSHKITGLSSGTARGDATNVGQVQDGKLNWVAAGGTADALTATYSPAITALVDGQLCFVRAASANTTTTPTFAPNSLTAYTITKLGGSAVVVGEWATDQELILRYKLASTRWELLNPSPLVGGTITGNLNLSAATINWARTTIASASTVNIGAAAANYLQVTGTTTITAFDTVQAGTLRVLEFAGALTLTHNATSLILPGGINITTAAGDVAIMISEGSGNWRCANYMRGNASPKQPTRTVLTSGSGTYTTPTGCVRLNIRLIGGGGGGAGGGGAGGNGGDTTFGALTGGKGTGGGASASQPGNGGAGSNGDINITGGSGSYINSAGIAGGAGGNGPFGGAGGSQYNATGQSAAANSGAGGGGSGATASTAGGNSGGAGGYVEKLIVSPAATYLYAVGAGGSAGEAGEANAGGAGGSGIIIVDEFYD